MAAIRVLVRRDILTVLTASGGDAIRSAAMTVPENFFKSRRAVGFWLLAVALVILAMVTIGGLTRLTGSGLSITQWDPIMGAIPPLNGAQWQDAFAQYRHIPQYIREHQAMSLAEFK